MSGVLSAGERLERIEELLDMEREELRSGNFDNLETLIGEREKHVAALHGAIAFDDTGSLDALRLIQSKAKRNARLLGAAKDGFAAGTRRVEEITAVRKKLSTYSENGQVFDILKSKSSVEKRA